VVHFVGALKSDSFLGALKYGPFCEGALKSGPFCGGTKSGPFFVGTEKWYIL